MKIAKNRVFARSKATWQTVPHLRRERIATPVCDLARNDRGVGQNITYLRQKFVTYCCCQGWGNVVISYYPIIWASTPQNRAHVIKKEEIVNPVGLTVRQCGDLS